MVWDYRHSQASKQCEHIPPACVLSIILFYGLNLVSFMLFASEHSAGVTFVIAEQHM